MRGRLTHRSTGKVTCGGQPQEQIRPTTHGLGLAILGPEERIIAWCVLCRRQWRGGEKILLCIRFCRQVNKRVGTFTASVD